MGTNLLIRDLAPEVQNRILVCEGESRPPLEVCQGAGKAFYAADNGRPDAPPRSAEAKAYYERTKGKGFNGELYNAMWGLVSSRHADRWPDMAARRYFRNLDGKRTLFLIEQFDEERLEIVRDYVRQNSTSLRKSAASLAQRCT